MEIRKVSVYVFHLESIVEEKKDWIHECLWLRWLEMEDRLKMKMAAFV